MNNKVPILVYHRISAENTIRPMNEAEFYTVTAANFRQQMEYLKAERYAKVVITFDDGDISHYLYVLPMLKELKMEAYFFITVLRVGTPGYMNWRQIKQLSENGMVIGSHGLTHRELNKLSVSEIRKELRDSKYILEKEIGKPIRHLSVPGGFYSRRVKRIAIDCGYEVVCASDFGINQLNSDLFSLKRMGIRYNTSMEDFKNLLNSGKWFQMRNKIFWRAKAMLKNLFGLENYTRIKEYILKNQKLN